MKDSDDIVTKFAKRWLAGESIAKIQEDYDPTDYPVEDLLRKYFYQDSEVDE